MHPHSLFIASSRILTLAPLYSKQSPYFPMFWFASILPSILWSTVFLAKNFVQNWNKCWEFVAGECAAVCGPSREHNTIWRREPKLDIGHRRTPTRQSVHVASLANTPMDYIGTVPMRSWLAKTTTTTTTNQRRATIDKRQQWSPRMSFTTRLSPAWSAIPMFDSTSEWTPHYRPI